MWMKTPMKVQSPWGITWTPSWVAAKQTYNVNIVAKWLSWHFPCRLLNSGSLQEIYRDEPKSLLVNVNIIVFIFIFKTYDSSDGETNSWDNHSDSQHYRDWLRLFNKTLQILRRIGNFVETNESLSLWWTVCVCLVWDIVDTIGMEGSGELGPSESSIWGDCVVSKEWGHVRSPWTLGSPR